MKRGIIVILLISILLVSPLVLAQEQSQTYTGFDRFIDNVKMFFTFGDNKVMLALNIREKELNSAIINTNNGENEKAEKNLERARKRLQYVQRKVSSEIAEEVKIDINETLDKINAEENLPDSFEIYALEEEKTGLTAELVIELGGEEGQTLTRGIVKDNTSGENKVEIVVEGDVGQTEIMGIEEQIEEIDNQISVKIVEREIARGVNQIETGMDIDGGDDINDTTPKTPAGDDLGPVDPGPQGIVGSDQG